MVRVDGKVNPWRTEDPYAISVDKNFGHHQRIVRRLATLLVSLNRLHRRQIQVAHHVAYEIRKVVLRQPVTQAGRQQQLFIRVVWPITFAHETLWVHSVSLRQEKPRPDLGFSDRLLGTVTAILHIPDGAG